MLIRRLTVVLRHNTTMPGDADLARREWAALVGEPGLALTSQELLDLYPSGAGPSPLLATAFEWAAVTWTGLDSAKAAELVRRSAFAQEVFIEGDGLKTVLANLRKRVGKAVTLATCYDAPRIVALAHNYVIETEATLSATVSSCRLATVIAALLSPFQTGRETPLSKKLRSARKTTLSLSHDLHIYKAKFFPRMVRALINIYGNNSIVFDPYCGSGTALLEAALLGQDTIGVDIDPICVMISQSKVNPFCDINANVVTEALHDFRAALAQRKPAKGFLFPDELERKITRRDRIDGTAYLSQIVDDASVLAGAVTTVAAPGIAGDLIRTIASDAATKKIRYRFIGVGNGRYTIEIVKQPLLERVVEKIDRALQLIGVFAELETELKIALGAVTVVQGDARMSATWPAVPKTAFLVTSPPYLPASSGREHYAASRALAFAILGFKSGQDGYFDSATSDLNPSVFDAGSEANRLMTYLLSDASADADPQRDAMRFERKAVPTASYLVDIKQFGRSLTQAAGTANLALVVADQHTFYSHRSGEVEHVVDCAVLYGELLGDAGLQLVEELELQLLKSAASRARPRAKDDYHEAVLIFEPVMDRDLGVPDKSMPNHICVQDTVAA